MKYCARCSLKYNPAIVQTCRRCFLEFKQKEVDKFQSEDYEAHDVFEDSQPPLEEVIEGETLRIFPTYGLVDLQLIKNFGKEVILEQYDLELLPDINSQFFSNECQFLQTLKGEGVPILQEFQIEESVLSIYYKSNGTDTLFDYFTTKISSQQAGSISLSPNQLIRWIWQLINAVKAMHIQRPYPIIHGNLNPASISVSDHGICLLNFGFLVSMKSILDSTERKHDFDRDLFADPSVQSFKDLSVQSDIFSIGRLIDFLLTGFVPESRISHPSSLEKENKSQADQLILNIRDRCLHPDRSKRYQNVEQILEDLPPPFVGNTVKLENHITCSCGQTNSSNHRFCVQCSKLVHQPISMKETSDYFSEIELNFDAQGEKVILENITSGQYANISDFVFREKLDEIQADPGLDGLICLDALPNINKLPHQQDAALRVIKEMRGRALLADEVGLGKTIEAGLVIKELTMREMVKNILVLSPKQLLNQWQVELFGKFDELFLVMGKDIDTSLAWSCTHLIAPYHILEQRFHSEELLTHHFDLVVLDEVHFLNDPDNWKIMRTVQNLSKKYFVLLSATPMHNDLEELYKLITLLKPGHFQDWSSFQNQYINGATPDEDKENGGKKIENKDASNEALGVKNVEELRSVLQQVMIRNTRVAVEKEFPFPKRNAIRRELTVTNKAQEFYDEFREFYITGLNRIKNQRFLNRMGEIVERLSSSPDAFRESINLLRRQIRNQLGDDFISTLEKYFLEYPPELVQPKLDMAFQLASEFIKDHKILIFSQFNETAKYAFEQAKNSDIKDFCYLYNENDSPIEKGNCLREFRVAEKGILFCPGEVSEGLNLQYASVMINLDLPWDPMKIEQRIGRIQRIGGKEEIFIINLILKNTIEEEILEILEQKIQMFEAVVGKVEEIVGNLSEEDDFRALIGNIYMDRKIEIYDEETDETTSLSAHEYLDQVVNRADQADDEGTDILKSIFAELLVQENA